MQFLSYAFVLLVYLARRMYNGGLACLKLILFGKFCLIKSKGLSCRWQYWCGVVWTSDIYVDIAKFQ